MLNESAHQAIPEADPGLASQRRPGRAAPTARSLGRRVAITLVSLSGLLTASGVCAQDVNDLRRDDRSTLGQPLDQGIEDVGAGLGQSGRIIDPGLRLPSGFQQVYRVPGRPGWLMRVDGALYALFRESVYDDQGPLIPPGTVFHIGGPPQSLVAPSPEQVARSTRLDARLRAMPVLARPADIRLGGRVAETPAPPAASASDDAAPISLPDALQGGIVDDGPYRRARLRELLLTAARADMARRHAQE